MIITLSGKKYYWSAKKFLVNLFVIIFVLIFWMVYISNVAKATSVRKFAEITVHHGDTLWTIAQQISPDSDPRATIKQIKTLNSLSNCDLISGQKLKIELAGNQ